MTTLDNKIRQINGPVNVVRMEGDLNGIRKVIYIMMNIPIPLYMQTECDNIFSRDIDKYLAEMFHDLNGSSIKYDFFLQIYPTELQNIKHGLPYDTQINPRLTYSYQIFKLFRKLFMFDPKTNRVNISKSVTNVRLHSIDMNSYFRTDLMSVYEAELLSDQMRSRLDVHLDALSRIIQILNNVREKYQLITNIMTSQDTNPTKKLSTKKLSTIKFPDAPKNDDQEHDTLKKDDQEHDAPPLTPQQQQELELEHISYMVNKIFYSYTNDDVRKKLTQQMEIIADYLEALISDCNNMVTSFTKIGDIVFATQDKLIRDDAYVSKFNYGLSSLVINDMVSHIWRNIIIHFDKLSNCFSKFTDVYFLRRFLDKKYITNGIVYTGSYHSWNYIEILAKQFDFKITHFAYSSIPNIGELNRKIREMDYTMFGEIFFPPIISQCSEMTHFPAKFL